MEYEKQIIATRIHLYPSGSCPGKFYGTAKIQNISENDTVDDLPIRPIVSNIGTATCDLVNKILSKAVVTTQSVGIHRKEHKTIYRTHPYEASAWWIQDGVIGRNPYLPMYPLKKLSKLL